MLTESSYVYCGKNRGLNFQDRLVWEANPENRELSHPALQARQHSSAPGGSPCASSDPMRISITPLESDRRREGDRHRELPHPNPQGTCRVLCTVASRLWRPASRTDTAMTRGSMTRSLRPQRRILSALPGAERKDVDEEVDDLVTVFALDPSPISLA